MPHCSFIEENIDFLKIPDFGQSTRTALESPKIDICQNWPKGALGDVSSCPETKFDKKIPMGSVPNCRKEIANRYGIRWFKCKLKPPKNHIRISEKLEYLSVWLRRRALYWSLKPKQHLLKQIENGILAIFNNVIVVDLGIYPERGCQPL